jgi:single-stranded-DNA-specific exonuclease
MTDHHTTTLPRFRWRTNATDNASVAAIATRFHLPLPVAGILGGRGLTNPDDIECFLDPCLKRLADPFEFPGMERAAARIWQALEAHEPMVIFGDLDADGVTASALLADAIRRLGGAVSVFLPDRMTEGYGLTPVSVARCLRENPAKLLITVDCGITSVAEIALFRKAGLDVVITDHHMSAARLPDACAIVNPRVAASAGAEHLCGAGVAFKLVHALLKMGRQKNHAPSAAYDVREWLDAVAVATVADVVPLLGENRILVTSGLAVLSRRPRLGLQALKQRAGLHGTLTSHHLAFVLGPRINAAGRMRTAWPALHLLHATDADAAASLAVELEGLNAERRTVEAKIVETALAQLHETPPQGAVVVAGEGWHPGAIGIVAARLTELWHLPTAVISLNPDGSGRGSVRGVRGDDVVALLNQCAGRLAGFGGHPRAAGFTLKSGALDDFKNQFSAAAIAQRGERDTSVELLIDGWLQHAEFGTDVWKAMQRLEPFGEGHARPRWAMRGVRLAGRPTPVGATGDHLKMAFTVGNRTVKAIWFKQGHLAEIITASGPELDVVFEFHMNTFNGESSLEMSVVDIRAASAN